MYSIFQGLKKFIVTIVFILVIVVFSVTCIRTSVLSVKHSEIKYNSFGIRFGSIDYSVGENISNFKLILSNISIVSKISEESQIVVKEAIFAINFRAIYFELKQSFDEDKKFDYPIFYFGLKGISVQNAIDFIGKNKLSNNYLNIKKRNNETILGNILLFLNKYQLNNFKVEMQFDDFDLQKTSTTYSNSRLQKNSLQIKKLIFFSAVKSSDFIGQIRLNYQLNNKDTTLLGLVLRQKIAKQSLVSKIIYGVKDSDYATLPLRLYGYSNQFISYGTDRPNIVHFNDFYDFFISYNIKNKDAFFEIINSSVNVQIPELKYSEVSLKDLNFEGRYHPDLRSLRINKFDFNLIRNSEKIGFEGELYLSEKSSEFLIRSKDSFDANYIYDYWPHGKAEKVKENLKVLIKKGNVEKNSELSIKKDLKSLFPDVRLELTGFDIELEKSLYEQNHTLRTPYTVVKILNRKAVISSDVASVNDTIDINDIKVVIPFEAGPAAKTKIDFNAKTTVENLEKFFFGKNEHGIISGDISFKTHYEIPHTNDISSINASMSTEAVIQDLLVKKGTKTHAFNSNNLKINLHNKILRVSADMRYEDIDLLEVLFSGKFHKNQDGSSRLLNESLHFTIPLNQQRVQNILDGYDVDLQGSASGNFDFKSETIKFDLENVALDIPLLKIKKLPKDSGVMSFKIDEDEQKISNINFSIPGVEMTGNIKLSGKNLIDTKLDFEKLNTNKFTLEFKNNNEYKISGTTIEFSDVQKIIDHFRKSKENKDTKSNNFFDIFVADLMLDKRSLLKDLKIKIGIKDGKLVKADGETYSPKKDAYTRLFFDEPVFALIVNNVGQFSYDTLGSRSLRKGWMSVYGDYNGERLTGDLYMKQFKLLESYLLSTILRIYSFSSNNIFQLLTNGINFSRMHCNVFFASDILHLDDCQAEGDTVLLNADARINFANDSGEIEGMVVPTSIINLPIIFLHRLFTGKKANLLESAEDRKNFSINWEDGSKPVIQTNPFSFILPSIFGYIFAQKRTMNVPDQQN
jgi:hypothetical protein